MAMIEEEGPYPFAAWKPSVPHPTFVPLVISFSTSGCAYNVGFTNPTGPFPAVKRCSLINVRTEAKRGDAKLVPYQK